MSVEEIRLLEGLWTRLLAGETLAPEERAALAAEAERDEVFRRRLLQDAQADGALRAMGQLDRGQESFLSAMKDLLRAANRTDEVVAAVSRRIQARRADDRERPAAEHPVGRAQRYVLGLAVLTAAAAALMLLWPRARVTGPALVDSLPMAGDQAGGSPAGVGRRGGAPTAATGLALAERAREPIARLETLAGRGYVHGGDGTVRSAAELPARAGDWVSTVGTAARARLVHVGGDEVELEGDVVAGLATATQGARVFIAHGRAVATLAGTPELASLSLASPHALVTGAGTIQLQVTGASTRVEVRQGRAHVAALGVQRGTEVETGQFAIVRADDLQPPRAQAAVREALLLVGPDDTKEDRPPPPALRASEERLKSRLERLGFSVRAIEATTLTPEEASAAALLVLSSSVAVTMLARSFADLPVPMVLLESSAFSQFGLTGDRWRRDIGITPPATTDLVITNPQHPLAGGLTGTVRVLSTPMTLRWAALPPTAEDIAGHVGAPDHVSLVFGYERGAAMEVGSAPARRVALFFGNGRVIRSLTEQGWQLFDAAVSWSTGR